MNVCGSRSLVPIERRPRATPWQRAQSIVWMSCALIVVGWGLWAIWCYGWRDLYADQWRMYRKLALAGFPQGLWVADNAHPSIFPNAIRLWSLARQDLNLEMQLWLGMSFAFISCLLASAAIARDRALTIAQRALAIFFVTAAILWLANARMLMHPHESIHAYLLVAMLMWAGANLPEAVDRSATSRHLLLALLAGAIAAFCFGPGLVVLAATLAAMILLRAGWRRCSIAALCLLVCVMPFFTVLRGSEHASSLLAFKGWRNIEIVGQWLATPFMQFLFPFFDPNQARWLPDPLSKLAVASSAAYAASFGNIWERAWPQAFIGFTGVLALLAFSFRLWHSCRPTTRTQILGLLLAWFGLGAAMLVSLSRLVYFNQYPGEIYANRYLPWSCLFWAGIALLFVGKASASRKALAFWQIAGFAVFAVVVMLNPIFSIWSKAVQALAKTHALALALDAYSTDMPQGETQPAELAALLPLLKEKHLAMFAWPTAKLAGSSMENVPAPASELHAHFDPIAGQDRIFGYASTVVLPPDYIIGWREHWVVLDAQKKIVGLASPFARNEAGMLLVVMQQVDLKQEFLLAPWREGNIGPTIELEVD